LPKHEKTLVTSIDLGRRRLLKPQHQVSKRQEGFWRPADTFGLAAVETFVKSPKQERRVNRLYYGGAGVPGNGGAAKKTAACAGMTLWFAVAAVLGVVGRFGYLAIARCMDAELYVRNAVTIAG